MNEAQVSNQRFNRVTSCIHNSPKKEKKNSQKQTTGTAAFINMQRQIVFQSYEIKYLTPDYVLVLKMNASMAIEWRKWKISN